MTPETKKYLREKYSIGERIRVAMTIEKVTFPQMLKEVNKELKVPLKDPSSQRSFFSSKSFKTWLGFRGKKQRINTDYE